MIPQRMCIVLLDGTDVPFLGGSARACNARVMERVRATRCPLHHFTSHGSHPAMRVAPDLALTPSLFDDRDFDEAVRESSLSYVETVAVHAGP